MTRGKILKSMVRDEERRRSPRISALDCKDAHQNRQVSTARTRMKRALDESAVSKLAKQVWKGRDSPQNADTSTDFSEWRSVELRMSKKNQKEDGHAVANGKPSVMPAKHVLELVLDTLQRRESYEIFAEPVDPDEVEDYCEIIKEPMDFGTMRAKLHEGMYQNLEQFEHDVFLIPENAMYFNSSATTYFRQARAINELAKKVFHVLKTDPENFVSEFSGTRRRSMRKALIETKDERGPSTSAFSRTNKKNPAVTDLHERDFLNGSRESFLTGAETADRRLTYSCHDKDSRDSTLYCSYKPLVLMNQGDISYKDSLLSYVKGLGQTAEMVAKMKLLGQHEASKHQIGSNTCSSSGAKDFKTFRDFTGGNPFLKASNNTVIDMTKDGEAVKCRDRRKERSESDNNNEDARGKKEYEMKKRVMTMGSKSIVCNDLNGSSTGKNSYVGRPVILALENAHSNVGKIKSRMKIHGVVAPRASTKAKPSCDEAHMVSRFTFDLSFLKARMNQMNARAGSYAVDQSGGFHYK